MVSLIAITNSIGSLRVAISFTVDTTKITADTTQYTADATKY
jgi:hypothetical protein